MFTFFIVIVWINFFALFTQYFNSNPRSFNCLYLHFRAQALESHFGLITPGFSYLKCFILFCHNRQRFSKTKDPRARATPLVSLPHITYSSLSHISPLLAPKFEYSRQYYLTVTYYWKNKTTKSRINVENLIMGSFKHDK